MTQKDFLVSDVDIQSIIKKSLKKDLSRVTPALVEAYVSEPKPFRQVSELVSQQTKDAHTALYKDYIDKLNRVSAELDNVDRSAINSNSCEFRSLKIDEVYNVNAKWMHELYFANCFDPHSQIYMDSIAYMRLQRDFGTFDDWQKDFIACALSAREGWAACVFHTHLLRYVNIFIDSHNHDVMIGAFPVIVVDMWSHAYYRDYLNNKKSYLVAQMREINWDVVEERFNKAESLCEVLK